MTNIDNNNYINNLEEAKSIEISFDNKKLLFNVNKIDEGYKLSSNTVDIKNNPLLEINFYLCNILKSKLYYIRTDDATDLTFKQLFQLYMDISNKFNAIELIINDDSRFCNTELTCYSATAYRLFNNKKSLYLSSNKYGFVPDFKKFNKNENYIKLYELTTKGEYNMIQYENDINYLIKVKVKDIKNYLDYFYLSYRNGMYNRIDDGIEVYNSIVTIDTLEDDFGLLLDKLKNSNNKLNYTCINKILGFLTRYKNMKTDRFFTYELNEKENEILFKYNRFMDASSYLISCNNKK